MFHTQFSFFGRESIVTFIELHLIPTNIFFNNVPHLTKLFIITLIILLVLLRILQIVILESFSGNHSNSWIKLSVSVLCTLMVFYQLLCEEDG